MVGYEAVEILERLVREVIANGVSGAMAECGVWKGGCMMVMALILKELGQERDLFLFDTFTGMTEPDQRDGEHGRGLFKTERDWCCASLSDVQANLATTGYPADRLHYVAGPVEKTLPEFAPDSLALLRLDTDWYSSTWWELQHLYPKLSPGGILIIDDYHAWPGCKKAVDDYFSGMDLSKPEPGHQVVVRKES